MTKKNQNAIEMINQFFSDLGGLEGMDKEIAIVIQELWKEGKLGRDELLSELERARVRAGDDDTKKA